MEQIINISKRIMLAAVMLVATQAVFSQEKAAVDYRAIQTKLIKIDGENVVKLIGDVFLVHN